MHYLSLGNFRKAIGDVTPPDIDPGYTVPAKPTVFAFPFPETKNTEAFPAIGAFWKLSNGTKQHVVGLCRRLDLTTKDEAYFPICGPSFMTGAWDAATMERRLAEACKNLPPSISPGTFRSLAQDGAGYAVGDGQCSFWKEYNSGGRTLGCKHVASAAFHIQQAAEVSMVLALLDKGASVTGLTADEVDDGSLIESFSRICPADGNGRRKFPVLVKGIHGEGKTFGVRMFGDTGGFDSVVECHGHAGIEAVDFLGGMLPMDGNGKSLVWVDGPVTEAFRLAANGMKVLLIADEIYRVPLRERSIFLTALSPAEKRDGTLVYRIKTGRPMKPTAIGLMPTMETLEAPENNLSIIGTTNVGPGYDVEDDDPAGASRWHAIFYAPGDAKRASILAGECSKLKYPESLTAKLIAVAKNMRKLRIDGEVKLVPSTREFVRALHISANAASVKDTLKDMAPSWVGLDTDGGPNAEQVKAVKGAITAAFK